MKRMLHLGCGPIHFSNVNGQVEWINIDKDPSSAADIIEDYLNISKLYKEGTINGIFSCHSIEHIKYPIEVVKFFTETFRVLQPLGTLRLVVPDLEKVCRAYCNGHDLSFIHGEDFKGYYHKKKSSAERLHFFVASPQWQHQICFDFELLKMLMEDAGFTLVRECAFGISFVPEFRGIDRFESESLVVEAQKP